MPSTKLDTSPALMNMGHMEHQHPNSGIAQLVSYTEDGQTGPVTLYKAYKVMPKGKMMNGE
ncbi:hypothetical protein ACTXT7_010578 [Hymenolepis weldensis]